MSSELRDRGTRRFAVTVAIAILATLVLMHSCFAQAQASVPLDKDELPPRVVDVRGEVRAGRAIDVYVQFLHAWSSMPGNSPWRLVPVINGRPLKGVYPTSVNLRLGRLQYDLKVNDDNRNVWIDALSPPTLSRSVRFSVGIESQDAFDTAYLIDSPKPLQLVVLDPFEAALATSVAVFCAAIFLRLAASTSLLTETVFNARGEAMVRFSLAKSQLALWFFVTFIAFIIIWLATGNYSTINTSVLAIMGISAGTAVGDSYMQSRRLDKVIESAESIAARGLNGPLLRPHARQALRRRLELLVRDLLSDGNGYSIYRFQMLAWTSVLILVFSCQVYYYLAIPSFNPELIYLMGLSSGTYVANRVPEINRQAREASIATARANAQDQSAAAAATADPGSQGDDPTIPGD